MNWFKQNSGAIVAVILTVILTSAATLYYDSYKNSVQYLEYTVNNSESLLSKAANVSDNNPLEFTVDGKVVKDISELDIIFFNQSNIDFKDLPIIIKFDQPKDFETISQTVFDQNNAKELIEPLELKAPSPFVRFGYTVKLLSRRGENPVLTLRYIFKGQSIPKFDVQINKEGVEARVYAKSQTMELTNRHLVFLFLFCFVSFVLGALVLVFLIKFSIQRFIHKVVEGLRLAKPTETKLSPEEIQRQADMDNNS